MLSFEEDVEFTRKMAYRCPKCGSESIGWGDYMMVTDEQGGEDEMLLDLICDTCGYDEYDNPDVPFIAPDAAEIARLQRWGLGKD